MSAPSVARERPLRIGEVAERSETTTRTIRYYEEIGLLACGETRAEGKHRTYREADVERVREIVRLRELLGLSLEQLRMVLHAETARAELRREFHETEDRDARRRILEEALGHIADQLALVHERRSELGRLESELEERRELARRRLAELDE